MIYRPSAKTSLDMERPSSGETSSGVPLDMLPPEVLHDIFARLSIHDRLMLSRVSSILQNIYLSSATLQYQFLLHTSAYLDVENVYQLPASAPVASSSSRSLPLIGTTSSHLALPSGFPRASYLSISPHTGKGRPSVDSVTLADWGDERVPAQDTSKLSTAEKIALLKSREARWRTLSEAHRRTFQVAGRVGVYELQEGVFLMCCDYNGGEFNLPRAIRLIPLPSATDPDLEDPITPTKKHSLGFCISDLTMDPTQDLIVVSEFRPGTPDHSLSAPTHRYHLLSMSNFQPHPMAALPTLDFPPLPQLGSHTRQLLQVMGDVLVIQVSRYGLHWPFLGAGLEVPNIPGMANEEEIAVWNWKSGRVLSRLALPANVWFSSLTVLSPTTFMITSTSSVSHVVGQLHPQAIANLFPPVIQIYSFAADLRHPIVPVQPLGPDYMDDTTPRPVLVAQLGLPTLGPSARVQSFEIRPDPAFPPPPRHIPTTLGARKPFTQDPSKGVVVFELVVEVPEVHRDPDDQEEDERMPASTKPVHYELFVLREMLVRLAQEGEERLRRSRLVTGHEDRIEVWDVLQNVPWSDWGEKNSRLTTVSMERRNWVCSCSGYRYAYLEPQALDDDSEDDQADDEDDEMMDPHSGPNTLNQVVVLDFSPYTCKKVELNLNASSNSNVTLHSHSEMFLAKDSEGAWKDDVSTALPYVAIAKEALYKSNGVMIDDQRVIVVSTSARGDGAKQELTVLCM